MRRSVVAVGASSGQRSAVSGQRPAASLVVPGVIAVVMGVEECHCQMGRGEMRPCVVAVGASSGQRPAASLVVPGVIGVVIGVMECQCTGSFTSTQERAPTELAAGDWPLVAIVPPPLSTFARWVEVRCVPASWLWGLPAASGQRPAWLCRV